MATDNHGKQAVRTLEDGDASVGVLDSVNVRISPALEGGNLLDIKTNIGSTVAPAAGTTNKLLTDIQADTSSLAGNVFFDLDDGSIAGGQSANLDVSLSHGYNGTMWERLVSVAGKLSVDVINSALPSGAATAANQTTGNSSLSSIDSKLSSVVSTANSSTTPLGAGATFTGAAEVVKDYATVSVYAFADQNSTANGLTIEWSSDGTNFDTSDLFTVTTTGTKLFTFGPAAQYMRVKYVNGAIAQGAFRLQTIFHPFYTKPSTHKISETLSAENDAELVVAVLSGENELGSFSNAGVTADGRLKVDASQTSATATLDDKVFGVDTTIITQITGSAETPALTLTNPSMSGKNLKIDTTLFASYGNAAIIFRRYHNPTGVTGGTSLTPINRLIGSSVTSVATVLQSPIVSTNGTLLHTTFTQAATESSLVQGSLVLKPGNVLHITITTDSNNKRWSYNLQWIEETE